MIEVADLCHVVRSKTAGPFTVSCDLFFIDKKHYETIKERGLMTKEIVAELYGIEPEKMVNFEYYDTCLLIKYALPRVVASGEFGDTDILGAQQQVPIHQLKWPIKWFPGAKKWQPPKRTS